MVKEKVSLKAVQKEIERIRRTVLCAYCSKEIEGEVEFMIHRDGYGEGPEVPLCVECGSHPTPTTGEIWNKIAQGG